MKNYYFLIFIISCVAPVMQASLAPENSQAVTSSHAAISPAKTTSPSPFNQSCSATFSLSGFFSFENIACKNAQAQFEGIAGENRLGETLSSLQICLRHKQSGVQQCFPAVKKVDCAKAAQMIAQALATASDD